MNEIIINNYVCANDSHNNSKRKKREKFGVVTQLDNYNK